MFRTQSANWWLVVVCVMGLATNGADFAYGGPGSSYGNVDPAFGYGSPFSIQPPYPNSLVPGRVSAFPPAPAPLSHVAAPVVDRDEIVLFTPADNFHDAQYVLNGVPAVMKPGTMRRLKNDRVWKVEVSSGTGLVRQYTLAPGSYKFVPTGISMSMGLFATQDRPEMSTVTSAWATLPSGLLASSTTAPLSIAPSPALAFEFPALRLIPRKWPGRVDEHPAPMISASQWFNTWTALSPEQLRNKVVLLDFWGSWCGPCVRNLPKIQALYQKYKDRGLVVVGVHSVQGAESVGAFLANHPYSFPVAVDTGDTADRYGVEGFPSYFLIDKSGKQTWKFGHEPPGEQQIENLLRW